MQCWIGGSIRPYLVINHLMVMRSAQDNVSCNSRDLNQEIFNRGAEKANCAGKLYFCFAGTVFYRR